MEGFIEEKIAEAQRELEKFDARKKEALKRIPEDDEALYEYNANAIAKRHYKNIIAELQAIADEIREEVE